MIAACLHAVAAAPLAPRRSAIVRAGSHAQVAAAHLSGGSAVDICSVFEAAVSVIVAAGLEQVAEASLCSCDSALIRALRYALAAAARQSSAAQRVAAPFRATVTIVVAAGLQVATVAALAS